MARIGFDYTPACEQSGGIGRYVRELVNALVRQDQTNFYHLFVAGASSGLLSPLAENFSWFPTYISPRWLARIWYRVWLPLPVEFFVGRVHLYHATDFVLPPTLPRTCTLLTVHDLSFVRVPGAASPRLKTYLDCVVPCSVKRADHILADSQATKDDLIDIYGLTSEKITVLLSGVDEFFHPIVDAEGLLTTRIRYKIGTTPYIFAVGTVQPRKNYSRLIEALARLRASGYDINLVIAGGKGWLENSIYETIQTANMQEHVHFIGFADDADLPALYSAATCFALPSLYEGFGLPVLEAMACGTPVITSNVSSLPEVAGDAALVVDPYDIDALTHSIQQVLDDEELRATLVKKGFERAKLFDWDNSARQLCQLYADLLS